MDGQKQVVDKLKDANNILVTVQNDPTIDALSASIGLTLLLNELGKHATAVFSGKVPHVLEFLQPEKTLETNTNSLRDFIISLDKSKADKLRYKVEDKVVKIFITPYKTSITDRDLEFSQGDFNVDVVVAIGVHTQDEIDQAVTAHGRILHDATVISVNTSEGEKLGSINWVDKEASSLSEMAASLADPMGKDKLDNQIATAFLTGIVEQTERFSNNKTTPKTMSISAKLLTAGANQELVASKLAEPEPEPEETIEEPLPRHREDDLPEGILSEEPAPRRKAEPGTLEIDHSSDDPFTELLPQLTEDSEPEKSEEDKFRADTEDKTDKGKEEEDAEERDPFAEDERQRPKRIEPLSDLSKPSLDLSKTEHEDTADSKDNKESDEGEKAEKIAVQPEPPKESAKDVSDEAVAALRELQQAHAKKGQGSDAAAKTAALNAAAEKAAEEYLKSKQINIDDSGHLRLMTPEHRQFLGEGHEADKAPTEGGEKASGQQEGSKFVLSPPSLGGTLTANSRPDDLKPEPQTDPLSMANAEKPMLEHGATVAPTADEAITALNQAAGAAPAASDAHQNLIAAAEQAITNPTPATPEPLVQPFDATETAQPVPQGPAPATPPPMPTPAGTPADTPLIEPLGADAAPAEQPSKPLDMPLPPSLNLPAPDLTPPGTPPAAAPPAPGTPPPVPPPMMPPYDPQNH